MVGVWNGMRCGGLGIGVVLLWELEKDDEMSALERRGGSDLSERKIRVGCAEKGVGEKQKKGFEGGGRTVELGVYYSIVLGGFS